MHEIVNPDNLKELTERDLRQEVRRFQGIVSQLRKQGDHNGVVPIEIEICYLQRELELRTRFSSKERTRPPQQRQPQIEFETEV
tara:strand:- start:8243 stop:8494 length:252 start_codon:yes stop_codon:yes gene_type:complete